MDLKLIKSKDIKELKDELKNIKNDNLELKEEWLNEDETAAFLKVCKKTLHRYRASGRLPYSKDGRTIRYRKSDIINYIKKYFFSTNETIK